MSDVMKENEEVLEEQSTTTEPNEPESDVIQVNTQQSDTTSEAENVQPDDTEDKKSVDKIKCFFAKLKAKIKNKDFTKKEIIIGATIAAAVILVVVTLFAVLPKLEFKKVENECVKIAGSVATGDDYFTIDTYPDEYKNLDESLKAVLGYSHGKKALEAIKHANREFGFPGSLYDDMMKTSALMGRRSEENNKYKVTWSYHPDDGLEVTYTKK